MGEFLSVPQYGGDVLRGDEAETVEQVRLDAALDEALCGTFPASDPVALNFVFTSIASIRSELIKRAFPRTRS